MTQKPMLTLNSAMSGVHVYMNSIIPLARVFCGAIFKITALGVFFFFFFLSKISHSLLSGLGTRQTRYGSFYDRLGLRSQTLH